MKKLLLAVIALIIISGIAYFSITSSFNNEIALERERTFTVGNGATLSSVSRQLVDDGILEDADILVWLDRFEGPATIFAGTYQLQPGMTARDLYDMLNAGEMIHEDIEVTIVEGWTMKEIANELADAGLVSAEEFEQAVTENAADFTRDYELLAGLPEGASLEGYLFPDTYRFLPDATTEDIVTTALDNLEEKLGDETKAQIRSADMSAHEIMTLASIIEKEVRSTDEMKTVSGIFRNRLDNDIALQADSTINYITRSGRARSTLEDLEIDSEYNTYQNRGLPPGPIANPGLRAIRAALNPADTDYLYFLTDKAGRVYYAETLQGHNENRQYLDRE